MGPKLDTLGPFLLEPEIPSASFRRQAGTGHVVVEALGSIDPRHEGALAACPTERMVTGVFNVTLPAPDFAQNCSWQSRKKADRLARHGRLPGHEGFKTFWSARFSTANACQLPPVKPQNRAISLAAHTSAATTKSPACPQDGVPPVRMGKACARPSTSTLSTRVTPAPSM